MSLQWISFGSAIARSEEADIPARAVAQDVPVSFVSPTLKQSAFSKHVERLKGKRQVPGPIAIAMKNYQVTYRKNGARDWSGASCNKNVRYFSIH